MQDFEKKLFVEAESQLSLSLIAAQMVIFRKLGNLLILKGVITEEEYKELVTSTVDDIKRIWSESCHEEN